MRTHRALLLHCRVTYTVGMAKSSSLVSDSSTRRVVDSERLIADVLLWQFGERAFLLEVGYSLRKIPVVGRCVEQAIMVYQPPSA